MSSPSKSVRSVAAACRGRVLVTGLALALAAVSPTAMAAPAETDALNRFSPPELSRHQWLGPDQKALPFSSDDQILDFLATAEVIKQKELSSGSTKPLKVLLEKDGVRANAIFRTIDIENGTGPRGFRDSYHFEVAAYEVSRLVGLNSVPPAVVRRHDNKEGSMQLWVESARSETDRIEKGDRPAFPSRLIYQKHMMRVFDHLIHNFDRNTGNVLVDSSGNLWMIDHTRSFKAWGDFPDGPPVAICERNLWHRLRALDADLIKERLRPHLTSVQLAALVKRHRKLVQHVEQLIRDQGEDSVLYDLV